MSKHEIAGAIQKRRESLTLKQEDLAEMAGITPKTIYLLETGKGNPSLQTMQKVLNVLGMEISINIKTMNK